MPRPHDASRRHALKTLVGVPLFPLAASPLAASLAACSNMNGKPGFVSGAFKAMAAPTLANPAAMATTTVGSGFVTTWSDGSTQEYALSYEKFFITGAKVANGSGGTVVAGGYWDIHNQPIVDPTDAGGRQFYSDCPDGMTLTTLASPTVAGVKGNTVFAVVQFE